MAPETWDGNSAYGAKADSTDLIVLVVRMRLTLSNKVSLVLSIQLRNGALGAGNEESALRRRARAREHEHVRTARVHPQSGISPPPPTGRASRTLAYIGESIFGARLLTGWRQASLIQRSWAADPNARPDAAQLEAELAQLHSSLDVAPLPPVDRPLVPGGEPSPVELTLHRRMSTADLPSGLQNGSAVYCLLLVCLYMTLFRGAS